MPEVVYICINQELISVKQYRINLVTIYVQREQVLDKIKNSFAVAIEQTTEIMIVPMAKKKLKKILSRMMKQFISLTKRLKVKSIEITCFAIKKVVKSLLKSLVIENCIGTVGSLIVFKTSCLFSVNLRSLTS